MIKTMTYVVGAMISLSVTAGAQTYSSHQSYTEFRGRNTQWEDRSNHRDNRDNGRTSDRRSGQQNNAGNEYYRNRERIEQGSSSSSNNGDQDIVRAVDSRRNVNFVEGSGMVVSQVLPDDNQGLRHQKFVVTLSNGAKMMAVYNLDMENCEKIPLKTGDTVAMGGEFKWTNQGPLLHWLHYDPSNRRPDGYVQHNGVDYCRTGARH